MLLIRVHSFFSPVGIRGSLLQDAMALEVALKQPRSPADWSTAGARFDGQAARTGRGHLGGEVQNEPVLDRPVQDRRTATGRIRGGLGRRGFCGRGAGRVIENFHVSNFGLSSRIAPLGDSRVRGRMRFAITPATLPTEPGTLRVVYMRPGRRRRRRLISQH